ncbi:hypothetical protein Vafri_7825 [Volvox africanus]|uniref:Phosphatidylserine decarboxylase n=1 Tax=Volvox africanus TaxID=51714 RepID=A0A8J4B181_9CHLO|nr:hypothetical protein Vafri_7825 [Volvox africanus]
MGGVISAFESYETTPGLLYRETGKPASEPMPLIRAARMWLLYQTLPGRIFLSLPPTWWVIGWQHKSIAVHANSPASKKDIPGLIKGYKIAVEEAEKPVEEYGTLQEFFARRLKPGLRPIYAAGDNRIAVMPADSRCVVYQDVDTAKRFWIKGRNFNVPALLGLPPGVHTPWHNCAISINRLSPTDCHRLHAAVSGAVTHVATHGHEFMGSEWAATHSSVNVMTENERLIVQFNSEEFGPVAQIMIGASEVGSVKGLVKVGDVVTKGDEVAIFAYGGSLMASLFVGGSIVFNEDLRRHTAAGYETLVKYGSPLGRATGTWRVLAPAAEMEPEDSK